MKKVFLLCLSLSLFLMGNAETTTIVASPGALKDAKGYATNLTQVKITGSINACDFKTIREDMKSLTDLDLSDVK